jgi:hypothetical protein
MDQNLGCIAEKGATDQITLPCLCRCRFTMIHMSSPRHRKAIFELFVLSEIRSRSTVYTCQQTDDGAKTTAPNLSLKH